MEDWPHSPVHRLDEQGAYMVTAGTYRKALVFNSRGKLTLLHDTLLELAKDYGWALQAWAIMPNHYHFVGISPQNPGSLQTLIRHLHSMTAIAVNRGDRSPGRRVWFQYWDTHITYQKSYLARLNYIHNNPAHHMIVADSRAYPWCSARWFEQTAPESFHKTVCSMKYDNIRVIDDFTECRGNMLL